MKMIMNPFDLMMNNLLLTDIMILVYLIIIIFITKTNIRIKEIPYKCNWCIHKIVCNYYNIYKIMIHTGDKPYMCNKCNKLFSLNIDFFIHMWIHTGDKPSQCKDYIISFLLKRRLLVLMRIHMRKKCHFCRYDIVLYKLKCSRNISFCSGEKPYYHNQYNISYFKINNDTINYIKYVIPYYYYFHG